MIEQLVGTPVMVGAVVVWFVAMAAVPIIAGSRQERARERAISLGVVAQVSVIIVILFAHWPVMSAVRAILFVPVLGWIAEVIGSSTGIPFGRYHYTAALQPQIRHVPLAIPAAWLMMMPPAWAIADLAVPGAPWWLSAVIAGAAFTAWDIYLDPHLVQWKFWEWDKPGRFYLGIPLTNFFGWFLWASIITAAVQPETLVGTPIWLVYVLTWLFQFGGHLVFWKMPVSAVVGFVAMALFAVPGLINMFGFG
jgi:putative membrane protein